MSRIRNPWGNHPTRNKDIVFMHHFKKKSLQQAAMKYGISTSRVKAICDRWFFCGAPHPYPETEEK